MSTPKSQSLNATQLTALHEAARRLVLLTMAGQHLRGGDGFVPVSDLQAISDLAHAGLTEDELSDLAADAAEYNEDGMFEPPTDLSVRVVRSLDDRFRWMLLRAVDDGGYAQHSVSDEQFQDYAGAFAAGAAALAAEGQERASRVIRAANDGTMALAPGVA